mmetsp:Transcript_6055/g.10883  ORF Transcript_6055/g.10883 Transcript_6055/m.10883 type:complete len:94 (-) Transcript_6055:581-862(-)
MGRNPRVEIAEVLKLFGDEYVNPRAIGQNTSPEAVLCSTQYLSSISSDLSEKHYRTPTRPKQSKAKNKEALQSYCKTNFISQTIPVQHGFCGH